MVGRRHSPGRRGRLALGLAAWRRRLLPNRWLLRALVFCTPLGFLAIEAGWTVTEVGRQPWVIYNILRTADAVTPVTGLMVPFITFMVLYLFLAVVVGWVMLRQVTAEPKPLEGRRPQCSRLNYSPPEPSWPPSPFTRSWVGPTLAQAFGFVGRRAAPKSSAPPYLRSPGPHLGSQSRLA